jgi:hypothetical protein
LINEHFCICTAQPLEQDRYQLTPEGITEHFRQLSLLPTSSYAPRLIINVDETGFGASKSSRLKSVKVIVPTSFKGKPVREKNLESHFMSAIVAMTLAGDVSNPSFIIKRDTDHPDASKASYFQYVARYSSEKAFVTWSIFGDYLRTMLLPFIQTAPSELGNLASPAILIFDGHRSHMSEVISAFAAEHGITLFLLPPHSSHLLQPLDQGSFRRTKLQFGQFPRLRDFSKATSTCKCVFMAI